MHRRVLVAVMGGLFVLADNAALVAPAAAQELEQPNIVVLMVDDLAEIDLRVWKRLPTIKATFLDRGVRFANFYSNDPLCCPGRAAFLTGQYTNNHGVWTNDARLFNPEGSLAVRLQEAGYYTFISGKYFNGTSRLADKSPVGWDHAAVFNGSYYEYTAWIDDREEVYGTAETDYSTDVFANYALEFTRQAPRNKPIFAFLTPYAVHGGRDANGVNTPYRPVVAPRHKGDTRCSSIKRWKPANYNEDDVTDKPAYIQALLKVGHDDKPKGYRKGWPMPPICRALLSVDEELAAIRAELKRQGRLKNTIFVLTADNGMGFGAHRWWPKRAPYTEQMPLFVSWPAGRGTGRDARHDFIQNVDLAPTLCEAAGCTMGPYPNGQTEPDGQSFLGLIAPAMSESVPQRTALYSLHKDPVMTPAWRAIHTTPDHPLGEWHYIENDTGEIELYDISGGHCRAWKVGQAGDPCRLDNLAGRPQVAGVETSLAEELALMDGGAPSGGSAVGSTVPRSSLVDIVAPRLTVHYGFVLRL